MARGGVRKGAGRPKGQGEPTERVRVPASMVLEIKQYAATRGFKLPLYAGRVQAGMPSATDDYSDEHMDLNSYLVKRPASTFLVRASGDSMIDANIRDGDLLVVDRSVKPSNGKIVIAAVDGQLTVKFLITKQGKPFLMPANAEYPPIPVDEENGVTVWGVVTSSVHEH